MPSSQSEVWVLKYLPESLTRTFVPRSEFVTSGKRNAESLSVTSVLKRLCSLKSSYCQSLSLPSAGAGRSLPWRLQLGEVLGFQSSHSCRSEPRCHTTSPPVLSLGGRFLKPDSSLNPSQRLCCPDTHKLRCPVLRSPDTSPGAPRPLSTQGLDVWPNGPNG